MTLTPEAMILVNKYINRDSSSPYLFPLLKSDKGTEEAYREYQLALRTFNRQLMLLGELLGLGERLSSYTARLYKAYERGIPVPIIIGLRLSISELRPC